jgi:hypothetical protein
MIRQIGLKVIRDGRPAIRGKGETMLKRYANWLIGALVLVVVVGGTALFIHRHRQAQAPSGEIDTATTQMSDDGLFRVSFVPSADPVPVNQMHSWTLEVLTADGQPVEDATITVSGDMPQHLHGMPTRPQVTGNLGAGRYQVEGFRFQMGGWWVIEFEISAPGRHDRVTFNLMLSR